MCSQRTKYVHIVRGPRNILQYIYSYSTYIQLGGLVTYNILYSSSGLAVLTIVLWYIFTLGYQLGYNLKIIRMFSRTPACTLARENNETTPTLFSLFTVDRTEHR